MTPFDNLPPASPQSGEPGSGDTAQRGKQSGSERRQRGVPVSVRFLPAERAALENRAQTAGLSVASFLRACALDAPGPRAQRKPHVNSVLLAQAVAALNRSGNVLNQIAHALNAGMSVSIGHQCYAALAENRAACAAIREAVGRKNRDDSQG